MFNLTGFYEHLNASKMEFSWHLLQIIKSKVKLLWFCFGDFNEITKSAKKKCKRSKPLSQMVAFQNALLSCGLHEINTFGVRFTWSNNRYDCNYTKEKLDRVLASKDGLATLLDSFF